MQRDRTAVQLAEIYRQGLCDLEMGDMGKARETFQNLLAGSAKPGSIYGLGLAHLGLGQYSYEVGDDYEAGKRFEVALAALEGNCRAEDLAEAHLWLGRYMAIGSPDEAMSHLETAAGYFSVIDRGEQEQACWLEIAEIAGWSSP